MGALAERHEPRLQVQLGGNDVEPAVRGQAAAALERMRVEAARALLPELLRDDDPGTRTQAALALGALGPGKPSRCSYKP